jgi:hypothetical protein
LEKDDEAAMLQILVEYLTPLKKARQIYVDRRQKARPVRNNKKSGATPMETVDPPVPVEVSEPPLVEATDVDFQLCKEEKKKVLDRLIVGTNMITRTLEEGIAAKADPPLRLILISRGDVENYQLYSHIPTMAHLSALDTKPVYVCALGKGVEKLLSEAMGIKRLVVLGFKYSLDENELLDKIFKIVEEKLKPVVLPWLKRRGEQESQAIPTFIAPSLKNLQTSFSLRKGGHKRKRS